MLFITAGPSTKLFAWGEGESGGHLWSYGTVLPITFPFEVFFFGFRSAAGGAPFRFRVTRKRKKVISTFATTLAPKSVEFRGLRSVLALGLHCFWRLPQRVGCDGKAPERLALDSQ